MNDHTRDKHRDDHLTDSEFAEVLDGAPGSPALQAHLVDCPRCQLELEGFRASVADFTRTAAAWSEAQPVPSLRDRVRTGRRPWATWKAAPLQWATAAVLCLGVGIPVFLHSEHRNRPGSQSSAAAVAASVEPEDATHGTDRVAGEDTEAQIEQDNALMKSVDLALAETDPSPVAEYRLGPFTAGPALRNKSKLSPRTQ